MKISSKATKAEPQTRNIFGKDYIPKSVVARMFNVTTQSLGRWIREGRITATKIGRDWYFQEKDIENYLAERTRVGIAT